MGVSFRSLIPETRIDAESILQTVREALVILTPDLRVIWANRSFYKTFQVEPIETERRLIFDLGNRQWNIPRLRALLTEVLPGSTEFQDFEVEDDFSGIGRRTMLLGARRLDTETNKTEMILLEIEDTTDRKRAEVRQFNIDLELKKVNEALRTLVLIDDLTGLYNRRGFMMFAEQHLKLARRTNQELLLVFLDLDGLKQINDSFGHSEGDRALAKTAKILKEAFHRDFDLVARLGGDEFVALTMDSLHQSSQGIYLRLQKHLNIINTDISRPYSLSFCIGVTHFNPKSRTTINDLMAEADEALYQRKRARTAVGRLPLGIREKGIPTKGIVRRLGTEEGDDVMTNINNASEKTIWESMIKQNMVPLDVDGSQSTYVLDGTKNSAVEIHFGTRYLTPPRQLAKVEPAVGRSRDTLDISSTEFLILNRNPALNASRQYIPWNKIFQMVFLDVEA